MEYSTGQRIKFITPNGVELEGDIIKAINDNYIIDGNSINIAKYRGLNHLVPESNILNKTTTGKPKEKFLGEFDGWVIKNFE